MVCQVSAHVKLLFLKILIILVCGDGIKEGKESCDDGNTNNNDGCSKDCEIEYSYSCI